MKMKNGTEYEAIALGPFLIALITSNQNSNTPPYLQISCGANTVSFCDKETLTALLECVEYTLSKYPSDDNDKG